MDDLIHLVKTAGPKMVPFIKAVIVYFMLVTFEPKGEIWTTIVKCAPILCLMFFIILYDFNLKGEHTYSQRILLGLVFSCIGDALLNIGLFPHGMCAFALAQIFYILAFGFYPIKPWIGLGLYSLVICFVLFIFNALDEVLMVGLPIYAFLLSTMAWRALARAQDNPDLINILCSFGSILFLFSDGCIAIDKFYTPIQNARIYIMSTYYAAQFAITLSVVNQKKCYGYSPDVSKKHIDDVSGNVSNKKVK